MQQVERQSRTSSNPAGVSLAHIDRERFAEVGCTATAGTPPARTASLLFLATFWPLDALATWILVGAWIVVSVVLGLIAGRFIQFGDRDHIQILREGQLWRDEDGQLHAENWHLRFHDGPERRDWDPVRAGEFFERLAKERGI